MEAAMTKSRTYEVRLSPTYFYSDGYSTSVIPDPLQERHTVAAASLDDPPAFDEVGKKLAVIPDWGRVLDSLDHGVVPMNSYSDGKDRLPKCSALRRDRIWANLIDHVKNAFAVKNAFGTNTFEGK
jgi:hypothetical protein